MPSLYDPDAALDTEFGELPCRAALADLVARSPGAWSLAVADGQPAGTDEQNTALVRSKLVEGSDFTPWHKDSFQKDELLQRLAAWQLYSNPKSGHTVVIEGVEVQAIGQFVLVTRRFFSAAWLEDKRDCENFFIDRTNRIAADVAKWFQSQNIPRVASIQRSEGPSWGEKSLASSVGEYMFAFHDIGWGDPTGEANG
jgi:hypothetical protein